MGQTEEIKMMSRPNRFTYTPITRGHKPTASQESNTLSTMSEVGQQLKVFGVEAYFRNDR